MSIRILTSDTFDREYKRLSKKYPSLKNDMLIFESNLISKPDFGIDLGNNIRKIRIAIKSKNKGKSGGARVITYNLIASIHDKIILLVTIYDKSETESISDSQIKQIVRSNGF